MAQAITHSHVPHRAAKERDYDREHEHAVMDEGLQYRRYGGFHFGAAFFGWLVSTGISVILTAILAAAGSAVAVTTVKSAQAVNAQSVATVGLVSGFLLLVVLAISYYAGGYVAGRMARFNGARQGLGVWIIGIIITIVLGAIGAIVGAQYNVLQQLNLPHLPVSQGSFTTGGLITMLIILIVSLVAAIVGGKVGERYHRKIDATGTVGHATV